MSESVCVFHFVVTNDQGSTNVDVTKNDVIVGRATECDLQLHSESISRKHLMISCKNSKIWVEDFGSVNGTSINGERIPAKTPVEIKDQDRITLGNTTYSIWVQADLPNVPVGLLHDIAEEDKLELEATLLFKKASNDRQEAEALLESAKQKVLAMIRDAEVEAEKKSQEIYSRAAAIQRKAEDFLKQQTQQAYNEADSIYAKAKEHGQSFLQDSRDQAQKIRDDASRIAEETRLRADKESQDALTHAKKRAQEIHDQRITAAEEEIRVKELGFNNRTELLRQEIAKVESQIQNLTAQREKDLVDVKAQEQRLADLDQFLKIREEDKSGLEKELLTLQDAAARLQSEITSAQKATMESQRAIEETRKHEAFLAERTQNLRQEIQMTEAKLQALALLRDKNQQEVDSLEKKTSELTDLLKKSEQELVSSRESLIDLNLQSEKIRNEILSAQSRLAEKLETEKSLISRNDLALQDIAATESRLKELISLRENREGEQRLLDQNVASLKMAAEKYNSEIKQSTDEITSLQSQASGLQTQVQQTRTKFADSQMALESLNSHLSTLAEEKLRHEKESQLQISSLKEKFESQKVESEKAEEVRFQRLQMETAKKIEQIEHEMMDQIQRRRGILEKELVLAVETTLKSVPENNPWPKTASTLQQQISQLLSSETSKTGPNSVGKSHRKQLTSKAAVPALWKNLAAMSLGAFLVFAGQMVMRDYVTGSSPISRQVAAQVQQQKAELAKRKFDPPQFPEMQKDYVGSVVSTRGFTEIYLDEGYQKRWFTAATAYLLKTWRMEEDASLQALSASAALVKNLKERRDAIHPDFIKDGLDKMHLQEKETLDRLRTIFGTQVRLESYLKFEHEYFDQNRAPASH